MFLERTVAPTVWPVTADEVRLQARMLSNEDDRLIEGLIRGATEHIEEMAGRALMAQTFKASMEGPRGTARVALPRHPVQSISAIDYFDGANAAQTLDPGADIAIYKDNDRAIIEPESGNWPPFYPRPDALQITFVAGYTGRLDVPFALRRAVIFLSEHWFSQGQHEGMPPAVEALVNDYRLGWMAA